MKLDVDSYAQIVVVNDGCRISYTKQDSDQWLVGHSSTISTDSLQELIDNFEPDETHWLELNATGSELDWLTTQVTL